jgi:multidrug efflux pump subunit AcrB
MIHVHPDKLRAKNLSFPKVADEILAQHLRRPAGSLADKEESDVTAVAELDTVEKLSIVPIRSGFEGHVTRLSDVATVSKGFERSRQIIKVQGHEGIVLNIQKSASTDILSAQLKVVEFVERYEKERPDSPIDLIIMDDESYDIRNRIGLISGNGALGFVLIIVILFLFLDFRSGFWVALGIPFSLAFTLIVALVIGYTINNMTLAAIIVILGVVVDDAIIVAEHVVRHRFGSAEPIPVEESVSRVMLPIIASVLTTCAAFLPLYFFEGRFGAFIIYIPTIVILMLGASLLESAFILPAHLGHTSRTGSGSTGGGMAKISRLRYRVTTMAEGYYGRALSMLLPYRILIFIGFIGLLAGALWLEQRDMKFVMFPREETREIRVRAIGPPDISRQDMAQLVRQVEDIFLNDTDGVVVAVRTSIGQSHRGGQVIDSEASVRVELTPPTERDVSLREIQSIWEEKLKQLKGFTSTKIMKSRFGSDSGSSIDIQVRTNKDEERRAVTAALKAGLEAIKGVNNVEVERPIERREYLLHVNRDETARLGVRFDELAATVRGFLEGRILYTLRSGEEEVDVRITAAPADKLVIDDLVAMSVSNRNGYLTPISNLATIEERSRPANIERIDFTRTTNVFADLEEGANATPLEVAHILEEEVFVSIRREYPNVNFVFRGEIEDSRRSGSDFAFSLVLAVTLIYVILVFLFESLLIPFAISAILPFGIVGIIAAFWSHGMVHYGFFALVGLLGMLGVVINDAIVMISRFEAERTLTGTPLGFEQIARLAATRLRPVLLTTATTVAGLFPTAYGLVGYDSMLAEMMMAMGWGLLFGTAITLILTPCLYSVARPVGRNSVEKLS